MARKIRPRKFPTSCGPRAPSPAGSTGSSRLTKRGVYTYSEETDGPRAPREVDALADRRDRHLCERAVLPYEKARASVFQRNVEAQLRDWEESADLEGAIVRVPALYVTGERDLGHIFVPDGIDTMKKHVPDLRGAVVL